MSLNIQRLWQWFPLALILGLLALVFSTGVQHDLSFENLRDHHTILLAWTQQNVWLAMGVYVVIYTLAVAISIPGATILTLTGGFLFGPILGTILVVCSATGGALVLFFAVQTAMGSWFTQKAGDAVAKLRSGFQENAFSYLLFLRLVPVFPFWVINIVPALLGVNLMTFFGATLIGIIPGSCVYVLVGHGLSDVFASQETPNLAIILQPSILYPLITLAVLSLLPIAYHKWQMRRKAKGKVSDDNS